MYRVQGLGFTVRDWGYNPTYSPLRLLQGIISRVIRPSTGSPNNPLTRKFTKLKTNISVEFRRWLGISHNAFGPYFGCIRTPNCGQILYLEGHGDKASDLIIRITNVIIWVIGVINLLTKSP